MQRRKLLLLAAIAVLVGSCAAPKPVRRVDHTSRATGVVFSLPMTRFDVTYELTSYAFEAGPFTQFLEACTAGNDLCRRLQRLGLKSRRLSSKPAFAKIECGCTTGSEESVDGKRVERRVALAAKDIVLAASSIPDPSHTYELPVESKFWESLGVDVELTGSGTIASGRASSSNELGQFAIDVAGAWLGKNLAEDVALFPRTVAPPKQCPATDYVAVAPDEIEAATRELEKMQNARRSLLASAAGNPGAAALLEALDREIAQARAEFEGLLEVDKSPATLVWVPSGTCPTIELAKFSACGDAAGKTDRARTLVLLGAIGTTEWTRFEQSVRDGIATPGAASTGWPYRVPAETNIFVQSVAAPPDKPADGASDLNSAGSAPLSNAGEPSAEWTAPPATSEPKYCTTASPADGRPIARQRVAQFGWVGALPPETGGRSSDITAKYYGDTGAISSVSVKTAGVSLAPVTQPIVQAVGRDGERTALKQHQADVEAMATICAKEALLNVPRSDFCPPPP